MRDFGQLLNSIHPHLRHLTSGKKRLIKNSISFTCLPKYTHTRTLAQSPGFVEYTDCFSAERLGLSPNEYLGYDTKQSDGKVPLILKLWGKLSTPSLPSLPGPLWS